MKGILFLALTITACSAVTGENAQRAAVSGGYQTEVGDCYVDALKVDSLKLYKECKAGVDARFGLTDGGVK